MKKTFSDLSVRTLPEGVYIDTRTPAFGLRVGKNRRTWFVVKGVQRQNIRLGHYPDLGVSEARKRALVLLGSPLTASTVHFPDAREEFLRTHGQKLRASSLREMSRTLRKHFHWTKGLEKITPNDILSAVEAIKAPSEANHAFKDIKTFFNWCVPRHLKHSPCTGLKPPHKSTPRSRVLSDEEIAIIWRACEKANRCKALAGEQRKSLLGEPPPLSASFCTIVQLLILTGQRRSEIGSLQFSWIQETIDPKTFLPLAQITLPANVTKNGREHSLPLGTLGYSIVQSANSDGRSGLLFPVHGHSLKPFSNWSSAKKDLDRKLGDKVPPWTLHDLRRYYSTTQARLKTPVDVTEALLNHVSGSRSEIQRIYDLHDRMDEMREAVIRFESHIRSLVG